MALARLGSQRYSSSYSPPPPPPPPGSPPAFVNASNGHSTGAQTITLPAGWLADDILILQVETDAQTNTTPTGWSQLASSPQTVGTPGDGQATGQQVFWKRATSGETSFTLADSGDHQGWTMTAFRGCTT